MFQVDNINSSATKRARTDGCSKEDERTCSSCGNANFSFRSTKTCNMCSCTQPRPADHTA